MIAGFSLLDDTARWVTTSNCEAFARGTQQHRSLFSYLIVSHVMVSYVIGLSARG